MKNEELTNFNDSFERCKKFPNFYKEFYERLIASSPEIADKFSSTDLKTQERALKRSLFIMMQIPEGHEINDPDLEILAVLHSRMAKNIRPELYTYWIESLIQTVQECDPKFDEHVENAWRVFLQRGVDYFISRY